MPSYSDATDETDTLEILCAKINALGSINAEMLDEIVFRMKDNVVSSIEHELTCDFSELDLNDAKRGPFKPWKLETKINDANVSDRLAKWKYSDLFIRIPSIFKGKNRYQISNIIDLVEANKYHIDIVKKNRDILDDDSETCKAFRSILTNLENIQVTIGELHYLVFNVLDSVHANDENDVETSMNQIVSAFQQILIKIPQARLSIKGKHIDTLEKKSNNSIPNVVNSANLICNSALLVKAHSINVIEKFNFQKVPYIASGSDDGMIRIWNMDQKNIDTILSDRKDPINALQYYEQEGESFIASGSADAIRVWNLRKKIITKRFKASATVTDLTLFKRKEQFILASISFETNFIEMWDIENEKLLERLSFPTNGRDGSSTITKYYKDDIPFLIIACYDRTIKIMNVVDDTIVAVLRTKDTVGQFKSLHVLHYLGVSVLISGSNYLHLWDLDLHCIINGVSHVGLVTSVDMIKCNDELCIVTGSTNGNMKIYNMDLAFVRGMYDIHRSCINSLCVYESFGRVCVAAGGIDCSIKIWSE